MFKMQNIKKNKPLCFIGYKIELKNNTYFLINIEKKETVFESKIYNDVQKWAYKNPLTFYKEKYQCKYCSCKNEEKRRAASLCCKNCFRKKENEKKIKNKKYLKNIV
jgi:hypothetical protein